MRINGILAAIGFFSTILVGPAYAQQNCMAQAQSACMAQYQWWWSQEDLNACIALEMRRCEEQCYTCHMPAKEERDLADVFEHKAMPGAMNQSKLLGDISDYLGQLGEAAKLAAE